MEVVEEETVEEEGERGVDIFWEMDASLSRSKTDCYDCFSDAIVWLWGSDAIGLYQVFVKID